MKRLDILSDCPEEFEEKLTEFIDYMESQFNDIRGLLDIKYISDIENINEAYNLAYKISDDLY